jgi:cytochrome P450
MLRDPYDVYARLRRVAPVYWHEQLEAWLVLGYADCSNILNNAKIFSKDLSSLDDSAPSEAASLHSLDGPDHAAVRRILVDALKQTDLAQWAQTSVNKAETLFDGCNLDSFDFVKSFSEPFAFNSMCILFGIPENELTGVTRAAQRAIVLGMDAGLDPTRADAGRQGIQHIDELLAQWIDEPSDVGLLSLIDFDQKKRVRQYLISSVRSVFLAGLQTAGSMMSCGMVALLDHGLLDGPRPWPVSPSGYNELVRHSGPVQVDYRICTQDMTIGETQIRRGDTVLPVLASANRDPEVFERPDELILDRSPNAHLGFGRGVHGCFGSGASHHLHTALLGRLTDRFRITSAGAPQIRPSGTLRGFDSVPITARSR